jgi:hypothetical protein
VIDSKKHVFKGATGARAEKVPAKRKAGASSRTLNRVLYKVNYTQKYRKVKMNFRNPVSGCLVRHPKREFGGVQAAGNKAGRE